MGRYIARRLVQGLVVILGVSIFVFVITRVVGDPVKFMLPLSASAEERDARREVLGLNDSIPIQFGRFAGDLAHLDLGESTYVRGEPALDVVFDYLPRTIQLVALGMLLAVVGSIPLGVLASRKPGGLVDRVLTTLSLIGLSMPQFFLGYILLIAFTVKLQWFESGPGPWRTHLVLPALCMALPAIGRLAIVVRSAMIDELNTQYVKVARAKGLSQRRILGVHALRNAGIPYVTLLGWEMIRALAGYSVVVESVFNWPGLGFMAKTAIQHQDFYLIQAIVLVVAVIVVLLNISIDIAYKALDPRVKLS
ncbi:MAG: peptide/nickel transport system permease protein [Acidimicrobiaceae bacterium]|nr:MAG: peptide/nickel transport system permease protein [Acidimicrobiaceae bacterium]